MAYDKRCDCANSGTGVKTPAGIKNNAQHVVTCTRCKQDVPATANSDGYSTLYTHLRPGKTLADRR